MSFDSTGPMSKKPRHSAKRSRSGQTIIEYALTVTIMTMIFGLVFYKVRIALFKIWVCQIAPRVAAPRGCTSVSDCWADVNGDKKFNPQSPNAERKCTDIGEVP